MSVRPKSHSIDANGIPLVVHDWGGAGAPTLLAHPTGFHGRVWEPIAEQFVARGPPRLVVRLPRPRRQRRTRRRLLVARLRRRRARGRRTPRRRRRSDTRRVRPFEGRRRAGPRRAEAAGNVPAHLGVRTDHLRVGDPASAAGGLLLGARRPQATQRVALDRRGVRRVRVEAPAQRHDRGVTARVRRLRTARPRRRRVRAEVPARGRSARVLDGPEPRRVRAARRDRIRRARRVRRDVDRCRAAARGQDRGTHPARSPRGDDRARPLRAAAGSRRVRRVDPALRSRAPEPQACFRSSITRVHCSGIGACTARRTNTGRRHRRSAA